MGNFLNKVFSYINTPPIDNELCSLAFLQSPSASIISDVNGDILYINEAFTGLTGYTTSDILGKNMSILKSSKHNNLFYKNLWNKLLTHKYYSFEIWNKCKDDSLKLLDEKTSQITINNKKYFIITISDITEKTKQSERHKYLATHDALTGLANRALLQDRFTHAIHNSKRINTKVALIMCDLNKFKEVNDNHGHNYGDKVLQNIADSLRAISREGDTIARYGGDEFIIVLENIQHSQEITNILDKLENNFPVTTQYNNIKTSTGASFGYACFPNDGENFEELLQVADTRMYTKKFSHTKNSEEILAHVI